METSVRHFNWPRSVITDIRRSCFIVTCLQLLRVKLPFRRFKKDKAQAIEHSRSGIEPLLSLSQAFLKLLETRVSEVCD